MRSARRVVDYLVVIGLIIALVYGGRYMGFFESDGPVVVADGDSLRMGGRKVRLHGIDAPELDQSCRLANDKSYRCGREARNFLKQLISRREVKCTLIDIDRYDRDVAVCRAGDTELNSAMVSNGWALAYRHHSGNYIKVEKSARQKQKGIWRGKFENPQEWRNKHRR